MVSIWSSWWCAVSNTLAPSCFMILSNQSYLYWRDTFWILFPASTVSDKSNRLIKYSIWCSSQYVLKNASSSMDACLNPWFTWIHVSLLYVCWYSFNKRCSKHILSIPVDTANTIWSCLDHPVASSSIIPFTSKHLNNLSSIHCYNKNRLLLHQETVLDCLLFKVISNTKAMLSYYNRLGLWN